jgi:hypothetical protein
MTLTIEIDNPSEVQQLLHVFKTMNLESIHVLIDKDVQDKVEETTDLLKIINRPIKKRLDIEALKKERNYKGINRARFNQLVKEINILEPIDLLLSQLSK